MSRVQENRGSLSFRGATSSDIDGMRAFIFEHGVSEWNHLPRAEVTAHLEAIRAGSTFGVVALVAGSLVGFATSTVGRLFAKYEDREGRERDHAYIREVVVHRDFAGQGIGTALLEQCKQEMLDRGIHTIYIDRHEGNAPSAAIMRKAGFVELESYFDPERRATGSRRSTVCRFVFAGAARS